jgi:Holliday junction resolvase RusA-like endonuclease
LLVYFMPDYNAIIDKIAIENFAWDYEAVIEGEPASKSNSRQIVRIKNRLVPIKSKKALNYERCFAASAPKIDPLIEGDVMLFCHIFYASYRPDLDESLIMDCLEGVAYKNDRQIKAKLILHGIDKTNPRVVVRVGRIERE